MAYSATEVSARFQLFSISGLLISIGIFLSGAALYAVIWGLYNLFLHPLRRIPGPILARASGIPYTLHMREGTIIPWLQKLHELYGDAVRVAPGEVSFISGETAWQDIYGFRTGKHRHTGPYLKDRAWFATPINKTYSIIASDEATHTRMRRNSAYAFSDKALREQESIIQSFVNLLVHNLYEEVQEGRVIVDIMRWYNYTTFDVIADLVFGEPLYCLRDKGYHPWVDMVFAFIKATPLLVSRRKYPMFEYYDRIKGLFKDNSVAMRRRQEFFNLAQQKVTNRMEKETDRPDFMGHILKNMPSEEKGLTRNEIDSNSVILLIAGSETTATQLSGTTYLILKHPAVYSKLVQEIRSRFKTQSEITVEEVNKLEWMIACFQEGMRHYPPVPTGFPRIVPAGGDTISGHYIAEGTAVYVSQHATNMSSRNYTDAEKFVPERWLGDERYKDDNKATFNPFSFGPRNCLGKNLAYAEMRLILAKMLFNFDLELVDKKNDWLKNQKVFTLWEKPSLMVKLHPVQR